MIPLLMAAGSAIASGVMGQKKANEARKIAAMNAQLGALDTKMNPWVKSESVKQAVPDAGPGALGGAFSGALSGYSAGQNISQGLAKENMYKSLMQKPAIPLQASSIDMNKIGAPGGLFASNSNPYSLLGR